MIVQNCTFTVHFPRNDNIRESIFDLEKQLSGFQKPFTLVPLPPDAPLDIPRIIAITDNQHSQLVFNGNSAQITTSFDSIYNSNIEKCLDYMKDKCSKLIESLHIIGAEQYGKPKFYFSGLSISLLFDQEDGIDDPIEYLSERFIRLKSNMKTDEAGLRIALVADDSFYVNIMLQNLRIFSNEPDERGSLAGISVQKNALQVVIDINDRFAFNTITGYTSSEETVRKVVDLVEKLSKTNIKSLIEDGEVLYAKQ